MRARVAAQLFILNYIVVSEITHTARFRLRQVMRLIRKTTIITYFFCRSLPRSRCSVFESALYCPSTGVSIYILLIHFSY